MERRGDRTRRSEIRWMLGEYAQVEKLAATSVLTVSAVVRRATLNLPVRSRVDEQMVGELRWLGMLRHQYPGTLTWSVEEKRRYWRMHDALMALARQVRERVRA